MAAGMRRAWPLALIVAVLLVAVAACGGKEAAPRPLTDADLRQMVVITSSGLPWQLVSQGDSAKSTEQAANDFADPETWLQKYQDWGRTGGHAADFGLSGSDTGAVQTQVEAYASVAGAKSAFSALSDFMSSDAWPRTLEGQGFAAVTVNKVNAPKVGDAAVTFAAAVISGGQRFDTFIVVFRRGAVLATVSLGAASGGEASADGVAAIAAQLDSRVKDILNQ